MKKSKRRVSHNPLAKYRERCLDTLKTQLAAGHPPGSMLSDVAALIEAISVTGVTSKGRVGNLPMELLPLLNTRLAEPIEVALKRPLLRDYPNIAGPYILLRVMGLVRCEKSRIAVDSTLLSRWLALNPFEQYFSLLATWLVEASGEVIGRGYWDEPEQFVSNLEFLGGLPSGKWRAIREWEQVGSLRGVPSPWNVQLQARFGLVEIGPLSMSARRWPIRTWMLGRAKRTPWGEAVAWAILESVDCCDENMLYLSCPEGLSSAHIRSALVPFFPEWKQSLKMGEMAKQPGTYVFKVSLNPKFHGGPIWKRMAVPGEFSLDDLAYAVLQAFGFYDLDHGYRFDFRDKLGKGRIYYHPYMDEGPFADEVSLEECGLPKKATMRFRFDFGDDWRFLLHLEDIQQDGTILTEPVVLASEGEAPPQYPEVE